MRADARSRLLFPAILAAAVALLYGRTLTFDFVNYDDYDLVVMNTEFLGDPGNVLTSFMTHAFATRRGEGVYYRPVLLMTFFADYAVWKLNPAGYHFTNLLLHLAATLLFYLLLAEALAQTGEGKGGAPGGPAAFFPALLFAVHPVQTESVAWISGRNDVLLGALIIASLWCYARQYRDGKFRQAMFPLSAALFTAAVLTKESAIFFMPLYPLYELTVRRESLMSLFSGRNHRKASVFIAIAVAYLGVRYNIFGAFIGAEKLYGVIPLDNRFLMAPGLAFANLLFLLWPAGLSVVHPIESVPWFEWPAILVPLAAGAGLCYACVRSVKNGPLLSWSLAWLLLGLVPLMNVFPLAVPVLEHRLYAASPGFAIALSFLLAVVGRRIGKEAHGPAIGSPGFTVPAALCVLLAVLTWVRVPVWKDSEVLWLDAIKKEPNASRAYFNLAGYYFERGQLDRTIPLLEKYVALRPDDFTGYAKMRQTYFLAGRPLDAARVCRKLIEREPGNASRYIEAGILFEKLGMSDSVIAVYSEGLRADPSSFQLHGRLGAWYRSRGDAQAAEGHLRAADSLMRAGGRPPAQAGR